MTERVMNDESVAEFAGEIAKRVWPQVQDMLAESYRMGFQAGQMSPPKNLTPEAAFLGAAQSYVAELDARGIWLWDINIPGRWNIKLHKKAKKPEI